MTKIVAYKGFDAELRCRGFQFELNKSFQHQGSVVACESGFHACEYPLDVFGYYPPASSRYGEVELSGDTSKEGKDTKIAAAEITIKAELKIPELIAAAVRYIVDRAKRIDGQHATGERELIEVRGDRAIATVSGHWSAATATGYQSAATATGCQSAATASGDWSAATASGDWSAATATGWRSAATASGNRSAATASGDWSAATATGYQSAATASGNRSAATATGIQSAATASGDQGAATASGDQGAATASGNRSAATATGYQGKVRGKEGCALFLVERNDQMEIIAVWAGVAGQSDIKPDTFYILQNGQPVETE
ncbi:DUF7666 domain-containing protein [Brucella anthropi]|uniref:DUF7666 domain-containing protein n=1 Tax=Brucella anthropi TaxID=529 RepID=UPI00244A3DFB|nr:hypothetical protein [Brucella anthropi]MDG9791954.1 hypothetical protein [Brucella anthropi]MDH0583399.1 hypothetical protein [Brucella anthropi]MDH0818232.1 hypothetical protein [Brucella anthropi]MDH2085390.1 hypothetical protein [Brucella anthropi]